ncbi:MAG: ATP-binding protein [Clostridiales bacterium]|jgi:predicted AAA+ superfamily ATPase|nr:ATP-binding protein [Clostridiales bacterium]
MSEYNEYKLLNNLTVFRGILRDEVIVDFLRLYETDEAEMEKHEAEFVHAMVEVSEEYHLSGNVFCKYIYLLLLKDKNKFSLACENHSMIIESSLYKLAKSDLDLIIRLTAVDISNIWRGTKEIMDYTPLDSFGGGWLDSFCNTHNSDELMDSLLEFFEENGCGALAFYDMFGLDNLGNMVPVENYDRVIFEDLVGLEHQKTALRENAERFLEQKPARHMLLTGGRGQGKSSCVKALANEYDNLKLIEIHKDKLCFLPKILSELKVRGKYFIILFDDLSFDDSDTTYKRLKSVLDGGVLTAPINVLFAATSNRRRLVRMSWAERQGDEPHISDTLNEKFSLADRFGLTIDFPNLSPDEYCNIVAELAEREGLNLNGKELRKRALTWDINRHGMSGRTARQFVDTLIMDSRK